MRKLGIGIVCLLASIAILQADDQKGLSARKGDKSQAHHGDMHHKMDEMNKMMVQKLGKNDPNYELRFIDMMIPHHEGAVMMAKHSLQHANRPELKEMAKKMIESQQKEIEQLKQWRQEWYGESTKN